LAEELLDNNNNRNNNNNNNRNNNNTRGRNNNNNARRSNNNDDDHDMEDDYDDMELNSRKKGSPVPVPRRNMRREQQQQQQQQQSDEDDDERRGGRKTQDDMEYEEAMNRKLQEKKDFRQVNDMDDGERLSPTIDEEGMLEKDSSISDSIEPIRYYEKDMVPNDPDKLKEWIVNPPDSGEDMFVCCYIIRKNKGSMFKATMYELRLEEDDRLLMVAREKRSMGGGTNVYMALSESDFHKDHAKRGPGYLGKLQSTKGNKEYTVYDNGLNPVDVMTASHQEFAEYNKKSNKAGRESLIRREMGYVVFQRGKDTQTDRRMEVCIPSIIATADGMEHTVDWRPMSDEDTMGSWFNRIRFKGAQNIMCRERMMCMHNRGFSSGRTSNLMDFRGRAHETSVKNFQLVVSPPQDRFLRQKYMQSPLGTIDTDDVSNVLVQMGRMGDTRFAVDFQYPVSALSAFGICLTRFVTKQSDE
jgi:hypothetical protein